MKALFTALSLAVLATGCTTVAYDGPARPDSEVATIESDRTMVSAIDGKDTPAFTGGNHAVYKVLPGEHVLSVKLNDTSAYPRVRTSSTALPAKLQAEAGVTYVTRPFYSGNLWRPQVVVKAVAAKPAEAASAAAPAASASN